MANRFSLPTQQEYIEKPIYQTPWQQLYGIGDELNRSAEYADQLNEAGSQQLNEFGKNTLTGTKQGQYALQQIDNYKKEAADVVAKYDYNIARPEVRAALKQLNRKIAQDPILQTAVANKQSYAALQEEYDKATAAGNVYEANKYFGLLQPYKQFAETDDPLARFSGSGPRKYEDIYEKLRKTGASVAVNGTEYRTDFDAQGNLRGFTSDSGKTYVKGSELADVYTKLFQDFYNGNAGQQLVEIGQYNYGPEVIQAELENTQARYAELSKKKKLSDAEKEQLILDQKYLEIAQEGDPSKIYAYRAFAETIPSLNRTFDFEKTSYSKTVNAKGIEDEKRLQEAVNMPSWTLGESNLNAEALKETANLYGKIKDGETFIPYGEVVKGNNTGKGGQGYYSMLASGYVPVDKDGNKVNVIDPDIRDSRIVGYRKEAPITSPAQLTELMQKDPQFAKYVNAASANGQINLRSIDAAGIKNITDSYVDFNLRNTAVATVLRPMNPERSQTILPAITSLSISNPKLIKYYDPVKGKYVEASEESLLALQNANNGNTQVMQKFGQEGGYQVSTVDKEGNTFTYSIPYSDQKAKYMLPLQQSFRQGTLNADGSEYDGYYNARTNGLVPSNAFGKFLLDHSGNNQTGLQLGQLYSNNGNAVFDVNVRYKSNPVNGTFVVEMQGSDGTFRPVTSDLPEATKMDLQRIIEETPVNTIDVGGSSKKTNTQFINQ